MVSNPRLSGGRVEEAEGLESGSAAAEAINASGVDPVAVAPALGGASREEADAFLDAAIAKFTFANQKGPHFADPLEGWGESLMAKNRSDLAFVKFAEAEKYAPNWGRLHLKWGEALMYTGKKDEARAQYQKASTLDLNLADKAELAMVSGHG